MIIHPSRCTDIFLISLSCFLLPRRYSEWNHIWKFLEINSFQGFSKRKKRVSIKPFHWNTNRMCVRCDMDMWWEAPIELFQEAWRACHYFLCYHNVIPPPTPFDLVFTNFRLCCWLQKSERKLFSVPQPTGDRHLRAHRRLWWHSVLQQFRILSR